MIIQVFAYMVILKLSMTFLLLSRKMLSITASDYFPIIISVIFYYSDGDSETATTIGKYCSTEIPDIIKSNGNKLYMKFVSDSIQPHRGFHITYHSSEIGKVRNYVIFVFVYSIVNLHFIRYSHRVTLTR